MFNQLTAEGHLLTPGRERRDQSKRLPNENSSCVSFVIDTHGKVAVGNAATLPARERGILP
jgi:hypothetical protein